MAARSASLLGLLLVVSSAAADQVDLVRLDNQLSECVSIDAMRRSSSGDIPVLSFEVKVIRPIAECGCKSALGSYSVFRAATDYRSYVIGGNLSLLRSGRKSLPLSAEQDLVVGKALEVVLSCARPD